MVFHTTFVLPLLALCIGHSLAMSTCNEFVGNIFLRNETIEGSNLQDVASKNFWACAGVEPDKTGYTSILLEFGDINTDEDGNPYLFLVITRNYTNMTSLTFEVKWTEEKINRFFWAEYFDGSYNIYHFFYDGLIVFHRCSQECLENGNVSFTVVAPIEDNFDTINKTLTELRDNLQAKFPSADIVYLDYPALSN